MLVKRRMEKITDDRKFTASKGYDPSKRVGSRSDETQNIVKEEVNIVKKKVYDPSKRIGE